MGRLAAWIKEEKKNKHKSNTFKSRERREERFANFIEFQFDSVF